MDKTDILEKTLEAKTLGTDSNYFKYIFKKTEKIVCAVFYILRSEQQSIRHDDTIIKDVEETAQKVMAKVLASLHTPIERSEESAHRVGHVLIELESKLRILTAARLLSNEYLTVFVQEIDTVLRGLRNYTMRPDMNPLFAEVSNISTSRQRPGDRMSRTVAPGMQSKGRPENSLPTRRDRVVSILKDKGQATIKDVSEIITDCSEKTLQRELNSLIDEGVVLREGERRWSKYSLI